GYGATWPGVARRGRATGRARCGLRLPAPATSGPGRHRETRRRGVEPRRRRREVATNRIAKRRLESRRGRPEARATKLVETALLPQQFLQDGIGVVQLA